MSTFHLISALGSSFAAGPGIEPVADQAAMRSKRNYAHQLAELLDARLVDLTVSGATTANVLDTPQQVAGDVIFPPQLHGVPFDADVVTITAGGNDLEFAPAMLYLAWRRQEPDSSITRALGAAFQHGITMPTNESVDRASVGLVRVVNQVRIAAPKARIALVDYLTVLGPESGPATPFTDDELELLLDMQAAVGRVFSDAAKSSGAELVRASTLSQSHGVGSNDPWVQPFHHTLERTAGSFHPNEAGMTAIAATLAATLRSS